MNEHDMTVESLIEIMPEAKKGNSGQIANYANECICLYTKSEDDIAQLSAFVATNAPSIINGALPLTNLSFGWDNARTFMALVPDNSRGIVQFEKGMDNKNGNQNDCYYIRFFSFKTADVPFQGSSPLVKAVCVALAKHWPNTKIISDGSRDTYTRISKARQSDEWRSQGLCQYCGGQLSMFKKCKSCGRKN